jgi:hypothetical protein
MPADIHVPQPGNPDDDDFDRASRRFVGAYYVLLSEDLEPALHPITPWRIALLDSLNSTVTIKGTANALRELHTRDQEVAHLLVAEMDAFSALVSLQPAPAAGPQPAAAATIPDTPRRTWWKRLLGIGKTAADSVKEILDNYLTPREKQIWKLCTELLDIMKGD